MSLLKKRDFFLLGDFLAAFCPALVLERSEALSVFFMSFPMPPYSRAPIFESLRELSIVVARSFGMLLNLLLRLDTSSTVAPI